MSAEWAFSRAVATALGEESCSQRQGWVGCVALWQLGVRSRGGYSAYGSSSEGLRAHGWAPSRSASGPGWDALPALLLGLFALFVRLSLLRFPLARYVLQGLRSWDRNRDGVRRVARPPVDSQSPGGGRVGWDTPLATVVWLDWLARGCGVEDNVTVSGLSEGLHSRGWALSRLAGAGSAGTSCLRFARAPRLFDSCLFCVIPACQVPSTTSPRRASKRNAK